MLAVGIIAMLSLGLVGIMGGSDDGDTEPQDQTNDEMLEPETEAEADPVTQAPVAETPIAGEEETETPVTEAPDTTAPDSEDEEIAEPVSYSPPPDLPIPVLSLDEMVTVVTLDGGTLSDDAVLVEGPETGENQDRSYIVEPPEDLHVIDLGYDADTTFAVTPNEDTALVIAALNTNIAGGESVIVSSTEDKVDGGGNVFSETVISKEYANNVDIVINIDQSQVGSHVTEIDLSNPADSLHFEFTNLRGFMHLITNEVESADTGDSLTDTTRTLYVIETPLDVRYLSANEISRIIDGDGAVDSQTRLVAEVHLGTSSLTQVGGSNGTPVTSQTIVDFTNDDPDISTNFYWASEGEHDGEDVTQEARPVAQTGDIIQSETADQTDQGQTSTPVVVPTAPSTPTTTPVVQVETTSPSADETPTTGSPLTSEEVTQNEIDRAFDMWDRANDNLDGVDIPRTNLPSFLT
ncbi:hypothetical protein [uncultured Sulfitobacter sp.]|uniref:hypothetical protein n=1 Tax=uncultured Sulfitobacter sp. TaxID=191468 RepID=UPI0026067512|nr:hypothetical protein [uncultured Sulfitobacter sp.]